MRPKPHGRSFRSRRWLATTVAVLVFVPLALSPYWLTRPPPSGCDIALVSQEPSPDRKRWAVVHSYDCGANAFDTMTHVSLLPAGERPRGPGNVLIADLDPVSAGTRSGPHAIVTWTAPHHLRVTRPPHARVIRAMNRLGEVTIEHVLTHG